MKIYVRKVLKQIYDKIKETDLDEVKEILEARNTWLFTTTHEINPHYKNITNLAAWKEMKKNKKHYSYLQDVYLIGEIIRLLPDSYEEEKQELEECLDVVKNIYLEEG